MAPPPTCGPGSPPQLLFQAAADGDLHLFKRTASALGDGRGRLREAVEAVKSRGSGALHVAAGRGRMPVCAYLVEELLVDVNASDDSGDTPLAYAVRSGTLDTVQYLLDHDANLDKSNRKGSTPLHLAAAGDPPGRDAWERRGCHASAREEGTSSGSGGEGGESQRGGGGSGVLMRWAAAEEAEAEQVAEEEAWAGGRATSSWAMEEEAGA
ncbi:hypothetical protein C2845_PM12G14170 [Panicum miliaceum]|uniref:Uncharacterized protein n=1 Tax=Panicum miliaceum TaxID=4540 RepID=A0A3L6QHL5_PANMI|nr:hypothetical protein C2845_PM12G14170 [Panicum miliaceum]